MIVDAWDLCTLARLRKDTPRVHFEGGYLQVVGSSQYLPHRYARQAKPAPTQSLSSRAMIFEEGDAESVVVEAAIIALQARRRSCFEL